MRVVNKLIFSLPHLPCTNSSKANGRNSRAKLHLTVVVEEIHGLLYRTSQYLAQLIEGAMGLHHAFKLCTNSLGDLRVITKPPPVRVKTFQAEFENIPRCNQKLQNQQATIAKPSKLGNSFICSDGLLKGAHIFTTRGPPYKDTKFLAEFDANSNVLPPGSGEGSNSGFESLFSPYYEEKSSESRRILLNLAFQLV